MSEGEASVPVAGRTEPKAPGRRLRLGSPGAWTVALGILAAVSFAAAIPLTVLADQVFLGLIAAVIGVPCAAVGFAATRCQRDNPLGWLFLVLAICQFIGTDGGAYVLTADRFGHHLPFVPVALGPAGLRRPFRGGTRRHGRGCVARADRAPGPRRFQRRPSGRR